MTCSSRSRNPNLLGRRLSHIYMYLLDHVTSKKVEKRKRGISSGLSLCISFYGTRPPDVLGFCGHV
jgi:hypothetical protein